MSDWNDLILAADNIQNIICKAKTPLKYSGLTSQIFVAARRFCDAVGWDKILDLRAAAENSKGDTGNA